MKRLGLVLTFWLAAAAALAQTPDPRDSVILESKSVLPGGGRPVFTLRVFITNKDSLTFFTLALKESSLTGNAYALLARPWCPSRVVIPLTNTLRIPGTCFPFPAYRGISPDSFLVAGGFDPLDPSSIEPPNPVRKAIWEIKFDSVLSNLGTIELDSARVGSIVTAFTTTEPRDIPVNFVKSIITVMPKGDFNLDGSLSSADVVELLNSIFLMEMPPSGAYPFDLNCDGARSPADAVLELQAVFLSQPFPC